MISSLEYCPVSAVRRSRLSPSAFSSGGSVCSACARAASCEHIGDGGLAEVELAAEHAEKLRLGGDDLVRRLDLRPQRGFLDRGIHDIRGQGQVSRFQLEAGQPCLRIGGFDRPPGQAEHIRRIGDGELSRRQRISLRARGQGRGQVAADPAGRRIEAGRDRRKQGAARGDAIFAGGPERGLRRFEIGILLQRALDERFEGRRMIDLPPLARNIGANSHMLIGRAGFCGAGQKTFDRRGRRRHEIRTNRAARKQSGRETRESPCAPSPAGPRCFRGITLHQLASHFR